jgi:hypothetical protein
MNEAAPGLLNPWYGRFLFSLSFADTIGYQEHQVLLRRDRSWIAGYALNICIFFCHKL